MSNKVVCLRAQCLNRDLSLAAKFYTKPSCARGNNKRFLWKSTGTRVCAFVWNNSVKNSNMFQCDATFECLGLKVQCFGLRLDVQCLGLAVAHPWLHLNFIWLANKVYQVLNFLEVFNTPLNWQKMRMFLCENNCTFFNFLEGCW
jgi:hypothetical protein